MHSPLGPMSRAQGIRGFFAWQTCTPHIQIACDLNQRKRTGYLPPELRTHGLRCEEVRRLPGDIRAAETDTVDAESHSPAATARR